MKLKPTQISSLLAAGALALLLSGCNGFPGRPRPGSEIVRPQDRLDFIALYRTNCAGCHGENGKNGAAIDLANPEYQSLVDDNSLRHWIKTGMPGTEMPAFGASGSLTGEQIDALVEGMRKNWSRSGLSGELKSDRAQNTGRLAYLRPGYLQTAAGDAGRGQQLYATACSSCHRPSSQQITNPAYLALVSDQALRSILIAGRPDIGQPDWRMGGASSPLSDQSVTDIVAYLGSLRSSTPGQPYSSVR
jgi:mono/diheme cytochrome c family protein